MPWVALTGSAAIYAEEYVAVAIILGGLAAVLLVGSFVLRMTADPTGVHIVNWGTDAKIPWGDIADIETASTRQGTTVQFCLNSGRSIKVTALSNVSYDEARRIAHQLRDIQHQAVHRDSPPPPEASNPQRRAVPVHRDSPPPPEVSKAQLRHRNRDYRWLMAEMVILPLIPVAFGLWMIRDAVSVRPAVYAHLRSDGVQLTARFQGCDSIHKENGACRLALTYRGKTRTVRYQDNFPQFNHVAVGAPVAVLLDPAHPRTVYTVHDVNSNDQAGVWSTATAFGVGLVALGCWFGVRFFRIERRSRKRMDALHDELGRIHNRYRANPYKRRKVKARDRARPRRRG